MNDSFISMEEIKKQLNDIKNFGSELSRSFSLLTQYIQYIFQKIKDCKTIEEAKEYFDLLDQAQGNLAFLAYHEDIPINSRLNKFLNDFDNLERDKEYYFNKIKNNEYKI